MRMKRFGAFLLFIGLGSFALPLIGVQFRLISLFGPNAQPIVGGVAAGIGLILLLVGSAIGSKQLPGGAALPVAPPRMPATIAPPPSPGQPAFCPRCLALLNGAANFCPTCGAPLPAMQRSAGALPIPPIHAAHPLPPPMPRGIGRWHSPMVALLCALLIPGAGQAYNGRPMKGFFLLFFSVLALPWLFSLYDAWAGANRIVATGGRMGKGGLGWVILQSWLVLNVGVLVLIILTMKGVLR